VYGGSSRRFGASDSTGGSSPSMRMLSAACGVLPGKHGAAAVGFQGVRGLLGVSVAPSDAATIFVRDTPSLRPTHRGLDSGAGGLAIMAPSSWLLASQLLGSLR
jgi:hypothetical protein